jgi:hypothetical protein
VLAGEPGLNGAFDVIRGDHDLLQRHCLVFRLVVPGSAPSGLLNAALSGVTYSRA